MKHRHLILALAFSLTTLSAYQPTETMFDGPHAVIAVPHQLSSNLLTVNGSEEFQRQVLNNRRPMVVLVDHPNRERGL